MTDRRVWLMLNGGISVYSVVADSEEDARRVIEKELAGKANRLYILRKWREEGRPVRESRPPVGGGKKK